jgi:peptidoglycan hydrolase CwlO-like protein
VGGLLPERIKSAGERALKLLEDRRDASIYHAIKTHNLRCVRIKEIETHVASKMRALADARKDLEKHLRQLKDVVEETNDLLMANERETKRLQTRLDRVKQKRHECMKHIDVLAERHADKSMKTAGEEAMGRARAQAARAKTRAGI